MMERSFLPSLKMGMWEGSQGRDPILTPPPLALTCLFTSTLSLGFQYPLYIFASF